MEIKLSERMQAVAEMVDCNSVADIGCDHAFVAIYLLQNNKCEKVVAMDLREGPLERAKEHIKRCGLSSAIDVRLSDGFEKLEVGETNCAIIAGMGGLLMTQILEKGVRHTDNGIHLVLQPQSDIDIVRAYLQKIEYKIVDENMLIDEGKYYTVIKALPDVDRDNQEYTNTELHYGPVLLRKGNAVLKKFLQEKMDKNNELIHNLSKADTEKSNIRIGEIIADNEIINDALRIME